MRLRLGMANIESKYTITTDSQYIHTCVIQTAISKISLLSSITGSDISRKLSIHLCCQLRCFNEMYTLSQLATSTSTKRYFN